MLEAILAEVRAEATREVAQLLTHPDQLQLVSDLRQKTLKKKNTIEVNFHFFIYFEGAVEYYCPNAIGRSQSC